jgi:hypothetical protein
MDAALRTGVVRAFAATDAVVSIALQRAGAGSIGLAGNDFAMMSEIC